MGSQHHACIATLTSQYTPHYRPVHPLASVRSARKYLPANTRHQLHRQNAPRRRPRLRTLPLHKPTARLTSTQLIAQCTTHFKLDSDRASLLRISDSLSTLSTFRQQHLSSLQSTLNRLSRTQQTLNSNHAHTLSQHNPTTHAAEILKLDTEKFKIAKQASDLEMEGERLEGELGRLGGVLGELETEGVEGGEREKGPEDDATVYATCLSRVTNATIADRPYTDLSLRYTVPSVSTSKRTPQPASTTKPSFGTRQRVTCMLSISTPSSHATSIQITFGGRCKGRVGSV